ncbi:Stp1/IreP family PP2C-type Ser/Thr phosphatase [Anaerospora hongkongensis]|uniref:Stp1/IreP family PP2C-type Ser/Thr phosphatase n=1 Tax=Anaerospora hongkongensis TaxID=244830 RepID=UPI0028975054|nr:Stp1/IreP family PP2C-type Ser/Thr phosphatase [Anaerospora hongkongensis]
MMLAYVKSDIGMVRKANEDSFAFEPPHLFVVADGMGGHVAGEVASSIAAATVKEYVLRNLGDVHPRQLLEQAILQANQEIFEKAQNHAEYAGMGTTVTAAILDESNIFWGHVGDSRLYYANNDVLEQLTSDHSLVWELIKAGTISKEEALVHPQRNILTRAVGTSEHLRVETGAYQYHPGDKVLLCTDGLTNMVGEDELALAMVNNTQDGQLILDGLIEKANNAGGNDNITAILIAL